MFGNNILNAHLYRFSYDIDGSATNSSIALQCNNCNIMGSAEPVKLAEFTDVDEYLCDVCAGRILDDLMEE